MDTLITVKDFSYSYDKKNYQLKNLNLNIQQGEVVVLIGKSGCGKSSITRAINGLIPYFYGGKLNGEVQIDGKPLSNLQSWEIAELTGNVFQDPRSQFFASEVAGEIAFGCENHGFTHEEIVQKVNDAAEQMEIKSLLMNSIHTLSYGMRQKVAIASAQALEPAIYIMDEPSANLDIESTKVFAQMIKKLKDLGKTIIIAEHRLYYLHGLANRYLYIENGQLVRELTSKELVALDSYSLRKMGLRAIDLYNLKPKIERTINKDSHVLKIENISKKIKGMQILKDISFQCHQHEIVALIGPNGAGKSTLGKILSGLQKSSSGKILIDKQKVRKERPMPIWYIPQDLDSQLFGEDLLDELLTGFKEDDSLTKKAEDILEELALYQFVEKHPSTLSGGQKQRLALGVALIYDVPIIVLDEPTSGLDGENMHRVSKILREISKKGKTIIIITHDVEFALNTCTRAIRLQDGKLTDDFIISSTEYLLEKMGYKNNL